MRFDRAWFRSDLFALVAVCAVVCIILPGYVIASAPSEFTNIAPQWLRLTSALLFVGATVCALVLYGLASVAGAQRWAGILIWGLLAWVCTAGVALPISRSVEMVAPIDTPIAPLALTIALAITAGIVGLVASGRGTIAKVYLAVQMTVALVPAAPGMWQAFFGQLPATAPAFLTVSSKRNILVVSFDDLSGALARQVLERDPSLRASLSDFTLFTNAVSNAPATMLSIQNELFGARDFAAISATTAGLAAGLNLNDLPLNDPRIDAMGYASYARFAVDPSRRVEVGDLAGGLDPNSAVANVLSLYEYVWVRIGTRFAVRALVKLTDWHLSPLTALGYVADPDCVTCDDLARRSRQHKGASWDRPSLNALRDIDALTGGLHTGPSPFSLRYMHFLFTHFPVDLDSACRYQADRQDWVDRHQTTAGATGETICALRKLRRVIMRMKQIGIYDSSLLVVKSDHGRIVRYFDAPPGNIGFAGSKVLGYDRYHPLLLIKPAGARGDGLTLSERSVQLSDLAATLCLRLPGARDCGRYPGVDILSPAKAHEPPLQLYIPKTASSTHRYDDLRPVTLPRGADLRRLARP